MTLTDNNGMLTSNVIRSRRLTLVTEMSEGGTGFERYRQARGRERLLAPSVPNSANRPTPGLHLIRSSLTIERIVDSLLANLMFNSKRRKWKLAFQRVSHVVGEAGFLFTYGARPMARLIQSKIKERLRKSFWRRPTRWRSTCRRERYVLSKTSREISRLGKSPV